jgi:hypothetical protein
VDRPLMGYWIGGYYPADQFPRGAQHRPQGTALCPDDLDFRAFASDYEDLYRRHLECHDDFVFMASPYWGIPWLEAILGCPVTVAAANCRAELRPNSLNGASQLATDLEGNQWMRSLLRFTQDLVRFADGRFPVCPPLLRGPGDAVCAMLGGSTFVTAMIDEPETMKRLLGHCAEVRLRVLRHLQDLIPAWRGTHAAGGYPSRLWCRRTVAYYQEDSAALLNPRLFSEFLLPLAQQVRQVAEVNFIHLHSVCLYPVDILLKDRSFDVFQINIDHEGAAPSIPRLIPTLRRIQQAGRPLLLWGHFTADQWELVHRELSPVGLSLQPFLSDGVEMEKWR